MAQLADCSVVFGENSKVWLHFKPRDVTEAGLWRRAFNQLAAEAAARGSLIGRPGGKAEALGEGNRIVVALTMDWESDVARAEAELETFLRLARKADDHVASLLGSDRPAFTVVKASDSAQGASARHAQA